MCNNVASPVFFDPSFWQGVLTTFLGAFLGILTALFTNWIIKRCQYNAEKKSILITIANLLNKNAGIVDQLIDQYKNENNPTTSFYPNNSVDLVFFNSPSIKMHDILHSHYSKAEVYAAIYELNKLNEILSLLKSLSALTLSKSRDQIVYQRDIIDQFREQLESTRKALKMAIGRVSEF